MQRNARSFLLSLSAPAQIIIMVGATIVSAFLIASVSGLFFDTHLLEANTDLTASVYQVLGTIYAILLTFTLWGVWQNFNEANTSAQNEAYALLDLVHIVEASPNWDVTEIRKLALEYSKVVLEKEWPALQIITTNFINTNELVCSASTRLIQEVQKIVPQDERESCIFSQTLKLLSNWLDARRTRILIARGNSAKALWPLLITGAVVLFVFHGLFVAKTIGIWSVLLFGSSLTIGLTFYLIFTLDCPFAGSLSIDSEPFQLAVKFLQNKDFDGASV